MGSRDPEEDYVVVKTTLPTLPLPSNSERATKTTERLILRPLKAEDVHDLHVLRTQPAVMRNTALGIVDADLATTQSRLDPYLPPNDANTHNWAICLKDTRALIGIGGSHRLKGIFNWPELGYMIREEYWGKGFTTEFVRAFLELYSQLPRSEVELKVHRESVPAGQDHVEEMMMAVTVPDNLASHNVLRKSGFERFTVFTEPDIRDPSRTIDLHLYRIFPLRLLKN